MNEQRLEIYATALIKKLAQSICDREKKIAGIPLYTCTIAEVFHKEAEKFCLSTTSDPELPRRLCLAELYQRVIKEKFNIFSEKGVTAIEHDTALSDISITQNHQKFALEMLFPELKVTGIIIEESRLLAPEAISRTEFHNILMINLTISNTLLPSIMLQIFL